MKPIIPVLPGFDEPVTVFAENQTDLYTPLPGWKGEDGTVVTRWHMSVTERLRILIFGDLWLTMLTFNEPLQPVRLDTVCPLSPPL